MGILFGFFLITNIFLLLGLIKSFFEDDEDDGIYIP